MSDDTVLISRALSVEPENGVVESAAEDAPGSLDEATPAVDQGPAAENLLYSTDDLSSDGAAPERGEGLPAAEVVADVEDVPHSEIPASSQKLADGESVASGESLPHGETVASGGSLPPSEGADGVVRPDDDVHAGSDEPTAALSGSGTEDAAVGTWADGPDEADGSVPADAVHDSPGAAAEPETVPHAGAGQYADAPEHAGTGPTGSDDQHDPVVAGDSSTAAEAAGDDVTAADGDATASGDDTTPEGDTTDGTAAAAGFGEAGSGDEGAAREGGAPDVPSAGSVADREAGRAAVAGGESASRKGLPEAKAEPVRQRRDQRAPADRRRADPEQILASYPWTYDPQTLREQVDEPDRLWDVADRLTDRLEFAERDNVRAGLLSLRAVVHRILGELDDALDDGREGLRHAEAAGELRTVAIAQARLAHVLQWRGEFDAADRIYAEVDSPELPSRMRAEIRELAGRSAFEQGRYLEAVNHFERALDVRHGEDPELVERIELALDAITRRTGDGWGPYPRTRDQILGLPEAPVPLLDDGAGLWGYAAAVEPRYAEAQPFAEGAAWVRRPDSAAWELIDQDGELLIPAAHGYVGVSRFAEGVAWVARDEGGWFAIDRENRLVGGAGGFEEVRPFRRGLALVRQGEVWGAVDRQGRIVVAPRFRQFATVLHVGGPVDGFSGDGLAVVDAGERFGVVDRAGRMVIEPAHAAVVIHPSAFLVQNAAGVWGALSRTGAPLVDMGHRDRDSVVEALPEETRPVL
ncbi:WG repeat-containing protein [Actinoplanes sp. NPDC023801]|uniref:WG repeat-containing protein n=1 Tax=Actinoplanes sp. NPDC023801 TaxID=3154595 RepID=UPI0033D2A3D9